MFKKKKKKKKINKNKNNPNKKTLKKNPTTRMRTKSALDAAVLVIQRTNARRSIQSALNVIKSITEDKCVESKKETINSNHLVETKKSRMNHLSLKKLH